MQNLEGSGTPVLYIGRTVLKGWSMENIVCSRHGHTRAQTGRPTQRT